MQKCCLFKLLLPGMEKWVLDLEYCIWLWLPVCLSCTDLAPDLDLYMLIYLHLSIHLGTSHLACLKEKPIFLLIVHTYIYIQTSAIKTLFFIAVTEHIILAGFTAWSALPLDIYMAYSLILPFLSSSKWDPSWPPI